MGGHTRGIGHRQEWRGLKRECELVGGLDHGEFDRGVTDSKCGVFTEGGEE